MRAVCVVDSKAGPVVIERTVPEPRPDAGQLMIRVCAAGLIPSELIWYPTSHDKAGNRRADAIPSHEFSGIVSAIGSGVTDVEVGQEIFGMNDWFSDGAMAEFCIADASWVAPKPPGLSHVA